MYRKRGDATTWLEAVKTNTNTWRWYVKPTSARGPDSSVCFGYGNCPTLKDPHECDDWYVYDNVKFVLEPGVTCVTHPFQNDSSTSQSDITEPRVEEVNSFTDDFEVVMPKSEFKLPECPNTPAF